MKAYHFQYLLTSHFIHLDQQVKRFTEIIIKKLNNFRMGNRNSSEMAIEDQNCTFFRQHCGQIDAQYEQQPFTSISQQINKLEDSANIQASKRKFWDQMVKSLPVQSYKMKFNSLDLTNYPVLTEDQNRIRFSKNPEKNKQDLTQIESRIFKSNAIDSLGFLKFVKEECVYDYYSILQKIKEGERGQIYRIMKKETSRIKILKIISKVSFRDKDLIKGVSEIENLLKLKHNHIVRLIQAYEDFNKYYIIFESIKGTSLLDYMRKTKISEEVGKQIIKQLLEVLQYIHNNGIIHRNVRLQNIMIQTPQDEAPVQIKLIGFGMSLTVEEADKEKPLYGSIFYACPQSLDHKINTKYDIWSVGILALLLFLNQDPSHFCKKTYLQEIFKRGQLFRQHLKKLPMHIKQFIVELLTMKNKRRPSASEALKMQWISGKKGEYKSRLRKGIDIDQEISNRS